MPSQATIGYTARAYADGVPAGAVYVLCRERGSPPAVASQLAEEAAAEAYRRALDHDCFHDDQHFRNWVAVTARNWTRDQFRRQRLPVPSGAAGAEGPSAVDHMDELEWLSACLCRLSRTDRDVLRYLYLEGKTLDETAAQLDPDGAGSLNARRLRILRRRDLALARLRAYIQ